METPAVVKEEPKPPTPREIDALVEAFEEVRDRVELADELYENKKAELIEIVQQFGNVPAGAESSLRLEGQVTILTVTTGSTIAVKDDAVLKLKRAMDANKHEALFTQMYNIHTKYKLRKGAEKVLRVAKIPVRLFEKYTKLYVRCHDVNKKAPSLKVEHINDAKPAKKGGR